MRRSIGPGQPLGATKPLSSARRMISLPNVDELRSPGWPTLFAFAFDHGFNLRRAPAPGVDNLLNRFKLTFHETAGEFVANSAVVTC